jgi:DNA modification methylase/rubredoxin
MQQDNSQSVLFEKQEQYNKPGPVECLGLTFESDEQRRNYFLEKLKEKLADPEFKSIEGFPIAKDEDILALSDPPYYTACPNPFIEDFISHYGKPYDPNIPYSRKPFAADVSEGKNDPIYNAHSYHTKVPHKAIMRYILHYTEPGDIVFDGFCGTGMTGVAAQLCADRKVVQSLGYHIQEDGTILDEQGKPFSKLGARKAILNDLSPAATFISYNYNTPVDVKAFEREAKQILKEVEDECGWMYETHHSDGRIGRINYTVWSDVFTCPECTREIIFWREAVDKEEGKVKDSFPCPHCNVTLTKRSMERAWVTRYDKALKQTIRQAKQVPVLINYSVGNKRYEKTPDKHDLALIEKIENSDIPYWFPIDRMPEGDESRRNDRTGLTHVHHFYTRRNLLVLAAVFQVFTKSRAKFLFTSSLINCTKLYRYRTNNKGGNVSGTLYVPSTPQENNVIRTLLRKLDDCLFNISNTEINIENCSASREQDIDSSVDYIFTDPPFGGNLMYSELNFLWEAWLKVFTNNKPEAITNDVQGKGLVEYQQLMTRCFEEYYRVLKPGRWMTVEFHNSQNKVWNAIQEALQRAGFVVADVRTLDKQQGSFKQVTSASAVKQDLIISSYKPNGGLEKRFELEAGTVEGAWDFVHTHMKQLPVFTGKNGQLEIIAERQNYLLYDRMVAFHVQRGVSIPLSAAEFYQGLEGRFAPRDGMYFLPEQVAEYDKKKMSVRDVLQLQLFVTDESSSIQWLKQQLLQKPQTFQEIHPQFIKEIGGWQKHEKPLELMDILSQNFLKYDGTGDVPNQIHSYLSTNYKDLRNLPKDSPALRAKAKDRWYVPDPNKAGDLEKLRERALLREFEEYRQSKERRLKLFRLEAIRAGFKKAWDEKDYKTIITIAEKVPENVLQEDPKLLMWYDQALMRSGEAD